jgi:hypothetical protein
MCLYASAAGFTSMIGSQLARSGQAVARVAAQGGVLEVVDSAVDQAEYLGVVADVGEGVAVGGDDDAVPVVPAWPGGPGGVDVVGFEARGSECRQAEGVEQCAGAFELLDEVRVLLGSPSPKMTASGANPSMASMI